MNPRKLVTTKINESTIFDICCVHGFVWENARDAKQPRVCTVQKKCFRYGYL